MDRRFLHENLNNDLSKIIDKRIAILGCGALGANLAISLARRGFNKFFLFDYDKIEEHNISTQPWVRQDIGRLKTRTLNAILWTISNAETYEYHKKIEEVQDIINALETGWKTDVDLIIDCFDNHEARQISQDLRDIAPVLHAGMSNRNTGEITWSSQYTVPKNVELDDPCNYALSRTLIELMTVTSSEAVINFLMNKQKVSYLINANTLAIVMTMMNISNKGKNNA
jgi:molybdopterin/thiamine biosynthesis adenylyltransferase